MRITATQHHASRLTRRCRCVRLTVEDGLIGGGVDDEVPREHVEGRHRRESWQARDLIRLSRRSVLGRHADGGEDHQSQGAEDDGTHGGGSRMGALETAWSKHTSGFSRRRWRCVSTARGGAPLTPCCICSLSASRSMALQATALATQTTTITHDGMGLRWLLPNDHRRPVGCVLAVRRVCSPMWPLL
jgi:hypothetical protein